MGQPRVAGHDACKSRVPPAFQQITLADAETGELNELRLGRREEAEKFYHDLAAQGMKVRVGMEASGARTLV